MVNPAQGKEAPKAVKRATAQKRQIQGEKRRLMNKQVRSRIKTSVRGFRENVQTQAASDLADSLCEVCSQIDKAAKKGIFKKNKASRLKSRLATKLNKTATKSR